MFPSAGGWGDDQRMEAVPFVLFYKALELKQTEGAADPGQTGTWPHLDQNIRPFIPQSAPALH